MLQQTQVQRVVPHYRRFVDRFPTLESLANAPDDEVLAAWSGLGYYRRARSLHEAARRISAAGRWPESREQLLRLPGFGPYTAAAVAAFAFAGDAPPVDGNIARVAARVLALDAPMGSGRLARQAEQWAQLLHRAAPTPEVWEALMELGARVCRPRAPECSHCPLADACAALAAGNPGRHPAPRPRRRREVHRWVALWLTRGDGRVLLRRRPPGQLLGTLWVPPLAELAEGQEPSTTAAELLLALGLSAGLRPAPPVAHAITYRDITVFPFAGECEAGQVSDGQGLVWAEPGDPGVATSTLTQKLRCALRPGGVTPARLEAVPCALGGVAVPVPTTPVLTVDALIADPERGVLLIRRGRDPFAGCWALPGGFVEVGESLVEACVREAREETGLEIEPVEVLGVYSDPSRDPRSHTVSVVFLCRATGGTAVGGDDAAEARWFPDLTGLPLAFDLATILADAGFLPRF